MYYSYSGEDYNKDCKDYKDCKDCKKSKKHRIVLCKRQEYIYSIIHTIQREISAYYHYFYIPKKVQYIRLANINAQNEYISIKPISDENIGLLFSEIPQDVEIMNFFLFLDNLHCISTKRNFFYHCYFYVLNSIKMLENIQINLEIITRNMLIFDTNTEDILIGNFENMNDYDDYNNEIVPELQFLKHCNYLFENGLKSLSIANIETIISKMDTMGTKTESYSRYKNQTFNNITQDIQKWKSTWARYCVSYHFLNYYYENVDLQTGDIKDTMLPILLKNSHINPEERI